jgi:hypothetical protein
MRFKEISLNSVNKILNTKSPKNIMITDKEFKGHFGTTSSTYAERIITGSLPFRHSPDSISNSSKIASCRF